MKTPILAGLLLLFLVGCVSQTPANEHTTNYPQSSGSFVLEISPVQCSGNLWDIWHAGLNRTYIRAPREQEILTEYLQTQGVRVLEYHLTAAPQGTIVCAACSCARGDTIQVRVGSEQEKALLVQIGWRPVR